MGMPDIVTLAIALLAIAIPFVTARSARTAPAVHLLAVAAALCVAAWFGLADGIGARPGVGLVAGILVAFSALIPASMVAARRAPCDERLDGEGGDAVGRACRVHDEADATISRIDGDRGRMSWLDRLGDSFVTTAEETSREVAWSRRAAAHQALATMVPPHHDRRTEELLGADAAARDAVSAMRRELAPLETVETAARDLHGVADQAMRALDNAISQLGTASTYEVMDLASSNKGISVMSSMQNSSASSAVQDASAAITRLSVAIREDIPTELRLAHDTADLIIDMALDSAFDFMSIFALSKISDAKRRCEAARERVAVVENRLAGSLSDATAKADVVRRRIASARAPFHRLAADELPRTARAHVRADPHAQAA